MSGIKGVPKYLRDYSTLMTAGATGNLAVTFLGSYGLKYEVMSKDEQSGIALVRFMFPIVQLLNQLPIRR